MSKFDFLEGELSERVREGGGPETGGAQRVRQDESSRENKLSPPSVPRSESSSSGGADGAQGDPATAAGAFAQDAGRTRSSGDRSRGGETKRRQSSDPKCPADAPAGTRCRLCGEVHKAREGSSVVGLIRAEGEAKTYFKEGKKR